MDSDAKHVPPRAGACPALRLEAREPGAGRRKTLRLTEVGEGVLELVDELDEVRVHGGQRGVEVVAVVREVVESGLCKRVQARPVGTTPPLGAKDASSRGNFLPGAYALLLTLPSRLI